jgi:Txe/YoeB family toxin of Txe-Axe toxin-antitoxin module
VSAPCCFPCGDGAGFLEALFALIKKVNDDHEAIEIVFQHGNAVLVSAEDYTSWLKNDRKGLAQINKIIEDVKRDPVTWIGKPELLEYHLSGAWSETDRR